MKLAYRLAYFSGGFIIGIALLFFILSGKKTSCAYGPEARTLKNIRLKERAFSESTLQILREHKLDTSAVSMLLEDGDVLFSESNTDLDSCRLYVIEGEILEKNLKITVENCEKLVTVLDAAVIQN
ncbi:DUF4258 domain-containing protein [Aequorivita vladivostokensis]|jgi:hypothetical protein|uniref:DUF4258 domain-containing protein n=1 Tax=Aequorivita vladivostokensis TaxID=171194 RepID=A0ABR5DFA4_9FLAO|nr:DUF4258 domain-containing protein [Aequorivita vladivostokensis]KJJ37441.1 hypothetical protein MB09_14540 [Aequorivita vladivostokensis]HBL78812.1 DUF4258 domain-containing protein [Aequorivita sp.]|tara:strand:+ start:498 stop:875 length:378 start_codon:yes stop_codon:yes gene_type:complete